MLRAFSSGLHGGAGIVLCLAMTVPVMAGPADDYEKGYAAFRRDDLMTAMQHLRIAADQGHAPSQALLGYILDRAEENEAAFELYEKAASQGNADGMFGLGTLYLNGEGVEQNDEQALAWFTRAAEAGHEVATMALATAYLEGRLGLAPDRQKAIEWLERSAARGSEAARDRLDRLAAEQE